MENEEKNVNVNLDEPAAPEESAEPKAPEVNPDDEKKYTDADVNAIIDKKFAKWKQDLERKETEAKKLAKMNADEKAKYEREKAERELADREAAITRRELAATAKETLAEKGLPSDLASVLDYTDAESCQASIAAVEKAFSAAVNKAVESKLKGGAPIPKAPEAGGVSREQFLRMTANERIALKMSDPELYESLKSKGR